MAFTPLTYQGEIPTSDSLNRALTDLQTQINTLNAAGTGSVTTVSVVTANGMSGTVATPTTTPAITLVVGAINLATATGLPEAGLSLTDITTNNVSITKHGFAPKGPNDATKYLDGTGAYSTPAGGFANPMTTGGDIIYGGAAGAATRLANGSSGQYLQSAGGTSAPTWATPIAVNNLTDTWNSGGTTFYGIKLNVTNTASAAGSRLLDLQISTVSKFGVQENGDIFAVGNIIWSTGANPMIQYRTGDNTLHIRRTDDAGDAGLVVSGLSAAAGATLDGNGLILPTGKQAYFASSTVFTDISNGVIKISDFAQTSFGRIVFGGTTTSFPALKRSSAVLQGRLADDSNFCQVQGLLTTAANAVTGLSAGALAATTNASIVITDASGQAYRVPCII